MWLDKSIRIKHECVSVEHETKKTDFCRMSLCRFLSYSISKIQRAPFMKERCAYFLHLDKCVLKNWCEKHM